MRPAAAALASALALLAGCHAPSRKPPSDTPGDRLEAAAVARGLVTDAAHAEPTGLYARDTDRLCILPAGDDYAVGVLVDYGDGQGCSASGTARRDENRLTLNLGAGCRINAKYDGDRIAFDADAPNGCDRLCTGRASLSAVEVERLSNSAPEAAALRDGRGRPLCGGAG